MLNIIVMYLYSIESGHLQPTAYSLQCEQINNIIIPEDDDTSRIRRESRMKSYLRNTIKRNSLYNHSNMYVQQFLLLTGIRLGVIGFSVFTEEIK